MPGVAEWHAWVRALTPFNHQLASVIFAKS